MKRLAYFLLLFVSFTNLSFAQGVGPNAGGSTGNGSFSGALTGPLGSSTTDSNSLAVTYGGAPPTGFTMPCAGAVGFEGALECLLLQTQTGVGVSGSAKVTNTMQIGGSDGTNLYNLKMDSSGDTLIAGATASGTTATENPILNGGKGQSSESPVTNGQKLNQMFDLAGKVVTSPYANRENQWQTAKISTTTNTTLLAANASLKTYLTDFDCSRVDAGTTAVDFTITDAASNVLVYGSIPNNGGGGAWVRSYTVPKHTSAINSALTLTANSTTGGSVSIACTANGFYGY